MQQKILQFIEEEILQHGAPPTLRCIAQSFGLSAVGTVQDHIKALVQKGFLEKAPGLARGLRLTRSFAHALGVPVLGRIPAGHPIEAIEARTGTLPVPYELARKGKLFALRVVGDSMSGAGIHDGDWIIARSQDHADHGDIVVALLDDGETTVKRLENQKGRVRLLPENPEFSPIEIRPDTLRIQGKVISVQRYYENVSF